MRCELHSSDLTSTVGGVCASCLRERLELIAAQAWAAQAQLPHDHHNQQVIHSTHVARVFSRSSAAVADVPRKSDPHLPAPQPLVLPHSVSPYISRRKSDDSAWVQLDGSDHRLFYSTPQVGPKYGCVDESATGSTNRATTTARRKYGRLWIFSKLFKTRSANYVSDQNRVACDSSSSYTSPSWFSTMFPGGRRRHMRTSSLEDSVPKSRRPRRRSDRGMSPVPNVDSEEDCDRSPSGSEYPTKLPSPRWNRTPMAATSTTARRTRHGYGRNVTGMAFCLSPLVRPSQARHWNHKGVTSELVISNEARTPSKSQTSSTMTFCKNRSRKLVDFGRGNPNR